MALKFLNNATFAGTVSTGGYLTLNSGDNIPRLIFNGSGDDFFFSNTANYLVYIIVLIVDGTLK